MKTILILTLFGVIITSTSCEKAKHSVEEETKAKHKAEKMIHDVKASDFEIITIDGCEYIAFKEVPGNNRGFGFMAHKGNCKNSIHSYRTPDTVKTQP